MYPKSLNVPLPNKRGKGYAEAMRGLKIGESVLLPTSAGSVVSLMGYLRRRGEARSGEFTVRSAGAKLARVWRVLCAEADKI